MICRMWRGSTALNNADSYETYLTNERFPPGEQNRHFSAAKRRKNAAQGASPGYKREEDQAPQGRKKCSHAHSPAVL